MVCLSRHRRIFSDPTSVDRFAGSDLDGSPSKNRPALPKNTPIGVGSSFPRFRSPLLNCLEWPCWRASKFVADVSEMILAALPDFSNRLVPATRGNHLASQTRLSSSIAARRAGSRGLIRRSTAGSTATKTLTGSQHAFHEFFRLSDRIVKVKTGSARHG